jgi:hypothetical protein
MKTRKQFLSVIAIAIIAIAIIGCKGDESTEQPVAQSKTITLANGKTVTVNFTALPNITPIWFSKLETQLSLLKGTFPNGNYILIVETGNLNNGFEVKNSGSKTATVSEKWLSSATELEILDGLLDITSDWIR